MYKVIHFFNDLQDHNYPYNVGDSFPREEFKVSDARLSELSGNLNKRGKPLIELVEAEQKSRITKTEILRMNKEELVKLADNIGFQESSKMSGSKLKEMIIKHYKL